MLNKLDQAALEQAWIIARRDPDRAEQLDAKLKEEKSWFGVATFAAYCVQCDTLGLRPWQEPPCVADENDPHERDKEAQDLLRRMLSAGVSRYDPDPRAAIASSYRR
jgi:hypothetical protein